MYCDWWWQVRQFQYLVSEDELDPEVLELRKQQRETEVIVGTGRA